MEKPNLNEYLKLQHDASLKRSLWYRDIVELVIPHPTLCGELVYEVFVFEPAGRYREIVRVAGMPYVVLLLASD